MRYSIDMALFGPLPTYTRVILVAENIDNHRQAAASGRLLRKAEQTAQTALADTPPTADPHLTVWHQAYRLFQVEEPQHVSMLETLFNRVIAGTPIPNADPLTNLLRSFALQYRIPVGGDDLDRISGNVWLRPARGSELFAPLHRPDELESPQIGEIIYVDDASMVLCRHWNTWPGDLAKITAATRNALLYFDALPPLEPLTIQDLADRLARLIRGFLGGEVTTYFLTAQQPTVYWEG